MLIISSSRLGDNVLQNESSDLVSQGPGGGKEIELLDRLKFPSMGGHERGREERCGGRCAPDGSSLLKTRTASHSCQSLCLWAY